MRNLTQFGSKYMPAVILTVFIYLEFQIAKKIVMKISSKYIMKEQV